MIPCLCETWAPSNPAYTVVLFSKKHESPSSLAGFFLSTSSLAVWVVIVCQLVLAFSIWIVGVRRFLCLEGVDRWALRRHSLLISHISASYGAPHFFKTWPRRPR